MQGPLLLEGLCALKMSEPSSGGRVITGQCDVSAFS